MGNLDSINSAVKNKKSLSIEMHRIIETSRQYNSYAHFLVANLVWKIHFCIKSISRSEHIKKDEHKNKIMWYNWKYKTNKPKGKSKNKKKKRNKKKKKKQWGRENERKRERERIWQSEVCLWMWEDRHIFETMVMAATMAAVTIKMA